MAEPDDVAREGAAALAWTSPVEQASGPCVFVDRDGVINERAEGGFVLEWDQFRWRPDALEALRILSDARLPIVVVSNQSCVGRGLLAPEKLTEIMARMVAALDANGSPLAAWYCCPHAPDASCDCRKPKPGMLRRAARESGFDLSRSHMIGDSGSDAVAGIAAGCETHLIDMGDPQSFAAVAREIAAPAR